VVGAPLGTSLGYAFDGVQGKYVRTGIIPAVQPGFSQFDQFFLAWTFGATDLAADRPICGARSNGGSYRTGANWRIAGSRLEVYGGSAAEGYNNFAAASGPPLGTVGLRALGGTAVSYSNGVPQVSTTAYRTDARPGVEEYVGTVNGIGAASFKGTIGCWFRGVGLTDEEYRAVDRATRRLAEAIMALRGPG
jgi:hypothetical protein